MGDPHEITDLLHTWRASDQEADREALIERLYPELRRLAQSRLRDRSDVSLQATELVHELYVRLFAQRHLDFANRSHFFAICGRLLRRALLDHARHRSRRKRGGDAVEVPLSDDEVTLIADGRTLDVLMLDTAIGRLEAVDPVAARVVELRFFAGMSHDETAEVLGIGRATVGRSWRFARAFLRRQMDDGAT
ncbi:MAG: ECF-type sigma factor [Acidobacteriota bacterium]